MVRFLSSKQVHGPLWQVGPSGVAETRTVSLSQSIYIIKITNDIREINNLIEDQEYTINNIAKVGFNYLVDNNCKFTDE